MSIYVTAIVRSEPQSRRLVLRSIVSNNRTKGRPQNEPSR